MSDPDNNKTDQNTLLIEMKVTFKTKPGVYIIEIIDILPPAQPPKKKTLIH